MPYKDESQIGWLFSSLSFLVRKNLQYFSSLFMVFPTKKNILDHRALNSIQKKATKV